MTTPITNYGVYTTEMNKPMLDKLFFLSHVDADIFVDFGCADGSMILAMTKMFPEHAYIGYDTDQKMIEVARDFQESSRNHFVSSWEEVIISLNKAKSFYGEDKKTCLILSSVVHEIFSYEDENGVEEFYQRVFDWGFDYIAVRDMGLFEPELLGKHTLSPFFIDKIYATADSGQVEEFESIWGKLSLKNNAIHFLLKYKYIDNWDREVKENYFSYSIDNFIRAAYDSQYKNVYFEHFSVPFIRRQIFNDFGFLMNDPTHYKLILEKN